MSVLNFSYNFNPRSYKRSDISIISVDIYPQISIHAPTRGATDYFYGKTDKLVISIHAPTRGATAKMHNIPYASLQ